MSSLDRLMMKVYQADGNRKRTATTHQAHPQQHAAAQQESPSAPSDREPPAHQVPASAAPHLNSPEAEAPVHEVHATAAPHYPRGQAAGAWSSVSVDTAEPGTPLSRPEDASDWSFATTTISTEFEHPTSLISGSHEASVPPQPHVSLPSEPASESEVAAAESDESAETDEVAQPTDVPDAVEEVPAAEATTDDHEAAEDATLEHEAIEHEAIEHATSEQEATEDATAEREPQLDAAAVFRPRWEVDALKWPKICTQLINEMKDGLESVVHQLVNSTTEASNVLAVTSYARGEGRTTLALCLAQRAAAAGAKVVLVDADFDKPQVAARLGLSITAGWERVLVESLSPAEVCVLSLEDHMAVLPLGEQAVDADLAAARTSVISILDELAADFDLVVVDAGPLSRATSGLLTDDNGHRPHAVVVQDMRFTTREQLQETLASLKQAGFAIFGVAENFTDPIPPQPQTAPG